MPSILHCFRCWLPLLALLTFGACQRASYSFQASTSAMPLSPVGTPAIVAPAAVPSPGGPAHRLATGRLRRQRPSAIRRHVSTPLVCVQRLPLLARQIVLLPRAASRPAPGQEPAPGASPATHRRTKGIALLLALLLGGIGGHLFYLGYYGRGAAYLAATVAGFLLLVVALIGSIATLYGGGAGFMGLAIAGVILSSVVSVLTLIDMVRIITGDLKPKNGEYFPRFFQTHDTSKQPTR